ncbi:MAG: potassium channel protein [Bacteroidota bacterium]
MGLRRIYLSLLLLLGVSLIGVLGLMMIEGYGFIDAIYLTVITMSTVGFGTIKTLSSAGKVFMVILIVVSASTFVYAVTTITTFVVEGEVKNLYSRYWMDKKVKKLKEHIIICGLGRNGREAANELLRQKQPFVVVESEEEVIEDFKLHHEGEELLAVIGDATDDDTLERANILAAKGLLSSLSSDAENVYITLTAREMNPRLHIVARAAHENTISKLKRAGANEVIVPNLIGGQKMVNLITRPALMEFVDMVTGVGSPDLHLEEITCKNHPKLVGKTLSQLQIRSRTGVLVLGYKHGGEHVEINPPAHRPVEENDRMFILGNVTQMDDFKEMYL